MPRDGIACPIPDHMPQCFKNRIGFAVRHFHTHKSHGMKDGTPKDMDPGVQPLVASGISVPICALPRPLRGIGLR